jgi:hypothetical protein
LGGARPVLAEIPGRAGFTGGFPGAYVKRFAAAQTGVRRPSAELRG